MGLFSAVKSFVVEKFWTPVVNESVYYNPFNTAAYALIFAVAAAYLGWPLLKKMGVKVNREFFIAITPFIFLGGAIRALKDINAANIFLLETPFIYFLMFGLFLSTAVIALGLEKYFEIPYHKPMAVFATFLLAITLSFYSVASLPLLGYFLVISAIWISVLLLGLKIFAPQYLNKRFVLPVSGHYFDATTTFVAIGFAGAEEKHVLARYFIDFFGPSGIFIEKTLLILPVVYLLYTDFEGEKRDYYLFIVALLGFAIGTRNLLQTLALG